MIPIKVCKTKSNFIIYKPAWYPSCTAAPTVPAGTWPEPQP